MCGARRLAVPLIAPGEGGALYTVRLTFAEVDNGAPGQRVFDIRIQAREMAADTDVARDAGGCAKTLVREFKGIHVDETLTLEFVAKVPDPLPEQMPVLQGVELVRERVLSVGVQRPAFELADVRPEQQDAVRLANHTDEDFVGILRVSAPAGFDMKPAEQPVVITRGQTCTLPVKSTVAREGPRGDFPFTVTLLRQDVTTEWEGRAAIYYLGRH